MAILAAMRVLAAVVCILAITLGIALCLGTAIGRMTASRPNPMLYPARRLILFGWVAVTFGCLGLYVLWLWR